MTKRTQLRDSNGFLGKSSIRESNVAISMTNVAVATEGNNSGEIFDGMKNNNVGLDVVEEEAGGEGSFPVIVVFNASCKSWYSMYMNARAIMELGSSLKTS